MMELFISAFVTLFVVIDPPGCAPIYASLTSGASIAQRRSMAIRAVGIAAAIQVGLRQRLGVELLQLPRQQPGLGLQRAGGGGGAGLASAAVKQLHIQFSLQVGNGHAHGRRHARQRPRRG